MLHELWDVYWKHEEDAEHLAKRPNWVKDGHSRVPADGCRVLGKALALGGEARMHLADEVQRRALQLYDTALGPDHPDTRNQKAEMTGVQNARIG